MIRAFPFYFLLIPAIFGVLSAPSVAAEQAEFFEKNVRPLLVEHCYRCHSDEGKNPKGGLRVDGRAYLLAGGDTGPAIVPGNADKSLLIEAIRYADPDLQMPPKAKLPADAIKVLEKWVQDGAHWPGDKAVAEKPAEAQFDVHALAKAHWSWSPIQRPEVPKVEPSARIPEPAHLDPVDRFLLAKLQEKGLTLAKPTDKATWLRRVTFAITGLPPTPAELEQFLNDPSEAAKERVIDRLLSSPAYGERWARHWLDLVRYAESRGHEFDYTLPNAYQYRDYVVRALNRDVPYTQFAQEHLAGDLLAEPRIDPETGRNESIIGTGFWHLGEEVHSPVDIRQDQADRLDNRIDVFSKTFLGLTVSCARCHDHKFDAISIKDYYALYGILEGSGYRQVRIDGWRQNREVAKKLANLRESSKLELTSDSAGADAPPKWKEWLQDASVVVDYGRLQPGQWLPDDVSFGSGPVSPGWITHRKGGTLRVEERPAAVIDPFWAGLKLAPGTQQDVGPLGKKPRAGFTIRTPNFTLEKPRLYYLVRGGGMAYASVCGHTIIHGPLHNRLTTGFPDSAEYRWIAQDVSDYIGLPVHAELNGDPETDFAVAMIVQADGPPPLVPPGADRELVKLSPDKERMLRQELGEAEAELAKQVVWESRTAPAQFEGSAYDERLFVRGNPRSLGDLVPRRSIEALHGSQPLQHETGSGRLQLTEQMLDSESNPYLARVAVNRLWHHLFGVGLVPSTDNFGVLGETPSHPELLDYLATEFARDGWSQKRMIRRLCLTEAYGMSSEQNPEAETIDPTNQWLHRFRVKRLEGEVIRDAILATTGELRRDIGGPSVRIHLTSFLEGRGRPGVNGPIDGHGRRSLYLAVRRNFLSPFLIAFDTPIPFSTVGKRQVSNVPAQALILLNDPFVHDQANKWGASLAGRNEPTEAKIDEAIVKAFGRPATSAERELCREFVTGRERDAEAWAELAHTLFNVKEFIYVP